MLDLSVVVTPGALTVGQDHPLPLLSQADKQVLNIETFSDFSGHLQTSVHLVLN